MAERIEDGVVDARADADPPLVPRTDVLGVGVSAVSMKTAVSEVARWVEEGEHHYVCVTGVHGVMESQRDPVLLQIHNASGLTVPDGMPLVWCSHRAGAHGVGRVRGPDLMLELLDLANRQDWAVFLYGGAPGIPDRLAQNLMMRFPSLRLAGTYSPPFRSLTADEDQQVIDLINRAAPQIVWVGLSTPKQEHWMAAHVGYLTANALVGVGAAFDVHAGTLRQAPPWIQRSGFEWLFRLANEPRRLWRRYLQNNPLFILRLLRHPPRAREVVS